MGRALNRLVEIKDVLRKLRASRRRKRETFTDQTIVLIYFWSVLNNQTRAWACDPENWPLKLPPGGLPSESQFSRRFRAATSGCWQWIRIGRSEGWAACSFARRKITAVAPAAASWISTS